jgi:hypothetical protein
VWQAQHVEEESVHGPGRAGLRGERAELGMADVAGDRS